jgi:gliding motility-associated-like protein
METSYAYNPSFVFPDGIEASYLVSLTATDSITGCFDTYTERINVRPDLLIFIPNAFTPDGDGLNDLWGPVLSNIDPDDYRLTVMDRWGEIVFETRDPNKKWNGGMNNSDYFAEPGVYIWIVETKEIGSLEEITQTGQVTLVR